MTVTRGAPGSLCTALLRAERVRGALLRTAQHYRPSAVAARRPRHKPRGVCDAFCAADAPRALSCSGPRRTGDRRSRRREAQPKGRPMRILSIGQRVLRVLDPDQRRAFLGLVPLMVVRAIFDTVGIATVLPFIAVVTDPQGALSNRYLGALYEALGFRETTPFLVLLGIGALFVLLLSNGLTVAVEYLVKRLAQRQSHLLQRRLMYLGLARPYEEFITGHSGQIGQNILNEVHQFVNGVISPYLMIVVRSIAMLVLLGLLVADVPRPALSTGVALAGIYSLILLLDRRVLHRSGVVRHWADVERFRAVTESFGGFKDVKVSGRERTFLERFARAARRHAGFEVELHVTRVVPRSLLEVVAFSGIIGIILYLLTTGRSTSAVISIVTLYAFACYRMIPAIQQVYEGVTTLRSSLPSLELRSEEHTSELQSRENLVCRLL